MKKTHQEDKLVEGKNLFYETKLDMRIGKTNANFSES